MNRDKEDSFSTAQWVAGKEVCWLARPAQAATPLSMVLTSRPPQHCGLCLWGLLTKCSQGLPPWCWHGSGVWEDRETLAEVIRVAQATGRQRERLLTHRSGRELVSFSPRMKGTHLPGSPTCCPCRPGS